MGAWYKNKYIVGGIIASVAIILILGLSLGLTCRQKKFESQIFFDRCKKLPTYDCKKLWDLFEQAHVNKDRCNSSMEAYNPLIAAVSFKPESNKALLWSRTEKLVKKLTQNCFQPFSTSFGSVLDGLTWFGKKGKDGTFTTRCPKLCLKKCENNTVRSFWKSASAAYADAAKGDVTALLPGYHCRPFKNSSIFKTVEVPRLQSPRVKSLNVVMVTRKSAIFRSNCNHKFLKELEVNMTNRGIKYTCKEVSESRINECASDQTCGNCFSGSWVMRPSFLSFIVLCFSFMF